MNAIEQGFTVKSDAFEGPLDVLLSLIEKRKLHINDVSLATVADDFIRYVESHQAFPLSQAAHFIYVAATLLLLKSKSLLPTLEFTQEEEGDMDDLEQRLALYARFRACATLVRKLFDADTRLFLKRPTPQERRFAPDAATTITSLEHAAVTALARMPSVQQHRETTVRTIVSLEDTLEKLHTRITREIQISFREFSGGARAAREQIVVSFLALLELIKQGQVIAEQHEHFGDISIATDEIGTPRYD